MKRGLLLFASVSMLLSTTSCRYLVKNIDDLVHLINLGDLPFRLMKDNIHDDKNATTIKLEYPDTAYNKQNYNIPSITPDARITVPDIPGVKTINTYTQPVKLKVPSENYVNCVHCNGTGKLSNSTCTHCIGSGKVFILK